VTLAIFAIVACGPAQPQTGSSEPTLAEAQGFLAQVVALAQRGDFKGLCAIGDGNCERSLDRAGRELVPREPPAVIGVRLLPTARTGDHVSTGGVILEMCGRDAAGKPYHSEMLVFRDRSTLRAINPVYWGNTKVAEGNSTPASVAPSTSC
jgi:hypothetical protein